MAKNRNQLEDEIPTIGTVMAANRKFMKIISVGTTKVNPSCNIGKSVPILDVQYISELSANLLSVIKIVKKGLRYCDVREIWL